jgi:hypothetical protein
MEIRQFKRVRYEQLSAPFGLVIEAFKVASFTARNMAPGAQGSSLHSSPIAHLLEPSDAWRYSFVTRRERDGVHIRNASFASMATVKE